MSAALRLDCRGLFCPVPIQRTAEGIRSLAEGEEIELLADDPGVPGDLSAWCRGAGHALLEMKEEGGVFAARVRKRARR